MEAEKRHLSVKQKVGAREAAARYRARRREKGYVALQIFAPAWLREELAQVIHDYVDVRIAEAEETAAAERRDD
jgi:hypothetical protein